MYTLKPKFFARIIVILLGIGLVSVSAMSPGLIHSSSTTVTSNSGGGTVHYAIASTTESSVEFNRNYLCFWPLNAMTQDPQQVCIPWGTYSSVFEFDYFPFRSV